MQLAAKNARREAPSSLNPLRRTQERGHSFLDAIQAHSLLKVFPLPDGGSKRAVDGLTFGVAQGEIYGLLGPNGAGKTTTLRLLSGMMQLTGGRAILNGFDVDTHPLEVKKQIGFLTANTGLYPRLTPRETLVFFGEMYGIDRRRAVERAQQLIEWLDMGDFSELRCGALSTGQKQRTSIARALVADPHILIMDEPTLGLDVLTNRIILDFIRRESQQGKTVLLSTHYLDEAERMCNRVGLLHNGRLVAEGTLEELRELSGEEKLTDIFLKLVDASPSLLVGGESA